MRYASVALAFSLAACASSPPSRGKQMGVAPSSARFKVREICDNYNRVIDNACQEIQDKATDPERKRVSIMVRIFTLTYTRHALSNPSPLAAFLDLWVMSLQRKEYLEKNGEKMFGDLAPIAATANDEIAAYIAKVADDIFPPDVRPKVDAEVTRFAAANPIQGYIREWQETEGTRSESLFKAVTGIVPSLGIKDTAASIADVSHAIDGVGEVVQDIPKVARWNTQLLMLDMDRNPSILSVRESIRGISDDVARFNDILERLPERVQGQLSKTLDEIDAKQEGIRKTLDDAKGVATEAKGAAEALRATVKDAETTVATAQQATEAFAVAGEKWQPVLQTLLDITGPAPKEYTPSKGPDPNIENLVRLSEHATSMATQLNDALGQARGILEGKAMDQLNANTRSTLDHTAGRLQDVIDHATWRAAELALGIAVLALVYRLVASRIKAR
jgi:hypothetical protein